MDHQQSSGGISVPWRSPTVQVVLLSSLVIPLSVALVSPGLPVVREVFGLTDARASLHLYDPRSRHRPVAVRRTAHRPDGAAARPRRKPAPLESRGASIALRPPYVVVLALRVLQGTALAGMAITTVTLIGDTFDGVRRNAVLGVNVAMISIGAAVYPIVGGYLFDVDWNVPFLLYLVGVPVAIFATVVLAEPQVEHESRNLTYLRQMLRALSWRKATVLYGLALGIDLLLFGAVFTALSFLLTATFGLSPVQIGLVVTVVAVGSTLAATENGRLARHLSDAHLIALGFGVTGAGFLGTWVAPSPVYVGAATFVVGAGWGLTVQSIDDGISELVTSKYRGGSLSLHNSTSFFGRAGGPVIFAFTGERTGYRVLLLAASVTAVAWALFVVFVRE